MAVDDDVEDAALIAGTLAADLAGKGKAVFLVDLTESGQLEAAVKSALAGQPQGPGRRVEPGGPPARGAVTARSRSGGAFGHRQDRAAQGRSAPSRVERGRCHPDSRRGGPGGRYGPSVDLGRPGGAAGGGRTLQRRAAPDHRRGRAVGGSAAGLRDDGRCRPDRRELGQERPAGPGMDRDRQGDRNRAQDPVRDPDRDQDRDPDEDGDREEAR